MVCNGKTGWMVIASYMLQHFYLFLKFHEREREEEEDEDSRALKGGGGIDAPPKSQSY